MKVYKIIGLMSGTSLDGLDIAYTTFYFREGWHYQLKACSHVPYPEKTTEMILKAYSGKASGLLEADHLLGEWMGHQVADFVKKFNIQPDLVVSHGQTIFHRPDKGYTMQIGNAWSIWKACGIPVINDLRSADLALGGQGAPLVPAGDDLLFYEYDFCLNLGGFSNISYQSAGRRIGFDICPVNIVLNLFSQKLGKPFDEGGRMAAEGEMDERLFVNLNALPYYHQQPPKSLGMEWVDESILPLMKDKIPVKNLLHTFTRHAAYQMAHVLNAAKVGGEQRVLLTGGGVYNNFLIKCLREYCDKGIRLVIPDENLIDYKEALIFGFLGLLKKLGKVNVYACVTGAKRDSSGGVLYSG